MVFAGEGKRRVFGVLKIGHNKSDRCRDGKGEGETRVIIWPSTLCTVLGGTNVSRRAIQLLRSSPRCSTMNRINK